MTWLLAALIGCSPTPAPPVEPVAPDVLLITIDTVRADALGAYGATPSPTPHLDALAARGTLVEEVQTTVPLTLPAHSSLMTGRWPDEHGVRDNLGFRLADDADTLAERFHAAGYATAAFVAAVVLDGSFGLDQGFDLYDDGFDLTTAGEDSLAVTQRDGAVVRAAAEQWWSAQEGPRFAWVHLYDAHRPLQAPEPFASQFEPYAAEVAYVDAQVGALLDTVGPNTIVLVVADHGEGNGEHGELTHGQLAYRSTMRVPLLLAGPGVEHTRLPGPVSVVDVAGTLTALAELPPLGSGSSLFAPAAIAYAETMYPRYNLGLHELAVAQDAEWRLIDGARAELFRWTDDPGEQSDLSADHPDVVARLRAELALHPRPVTGQSADSQTAAALAQLGYLAGLPADEGPLTDPRDAPDMATAFERVVIAARTRPPREGAVVLNDFLAEYPAVSGARQMLVAAWDAAGEYDEAIAALQPLRDARPTDGLLIAREAELHLSAGRADRARALLEPLRESEPELVAARALLAELYRRDGRCDAASAEADAGLATHPESSRLLLVRGACHREAGRHAEAEADLREALRLDPDSRDVHGVLAYVLADNGRLDAAATHFAAQLERTPERQELHALLGAALYGSEQWLAAVAPLQAAVAAPSDAESRLLLADALLRTGGDVERVQTLLDEATVLQPTDPRLREVRAALLMQRGEVEAAIQLLAEP